jgi:hypothetical protein
VTRINRRLLLRTKTTPPNCRPRLLPCRRRGHAGGAPAPRFEVHKAQVRPPPGLASSWLGVRGCRSRGSRSASRPGRARLGDSTSATVPPLSGPGSRMWACGRESIRSQKRASGTFACRRRRGSRDGMQNPPSSYAVRVSACRLPRGATSVGSSRTGVVCRLAGLTSPQ